jgi:hypothetical protein
MPLIKIGYLLIRTVSKPVANLMKQQTKSHPGFRAVCIRFAQAYHRTEIRLTRRLNRVANSGSEAVAASVIRPLDEQKAIEVGANFLGEALVFVVAGGILVLDSASNARKEQLRRLAIEERFQQLEKKIESLSASLNQESGSNKHARP